MDSSYGYELRLRQKYSLCWFQKTGSEFQRLQAEVQLLRGQKWSYSYHSYGSTQDDEHLCGKRRTEPVVTSTWRERDYGTCVLICT